MCQAASQTGRPAGGASRPKDAAAPRPSPVRSVDPVVRAIHTLMYGLVVHFGTLYMIESCADNTTNANGDVGIEDGAPVAFVTKVGGAEDGASVYPGHLLAILFLHEYWVYLQHSNVVGNPLLQHLDRQYGIALLKSNRHWSIAGTLSAYWARETLGMFLCLPFLQQSSDRGSFSGTQYLILYSLIYHTIKSRGVRKDALTRSSSRFGIMRLVIDKFYTHSSEEAGVTLLRLFLQGVDTFIHYFIVRDLALLAGASYGGWFVQSMHVLFAIWVAHAMLNQLFRCSTASVMVQAWHLLTAKASSAASAVVDGVSDEQHHLSMQRTESEAELWERHREWNGMPADNEDDDTACTEGPNEFGWEDVAKDDETVGESVSSDSDGAFDDDVDAPANACEIDCADDDFVVRQLLHHKRVADELKGRQGAASGGVDRAVRLETAIAMLAAFFMLGLGEVPLQALLSWNECFDIEGILHKRERTTLGALGAWTMWGLLHGMWAMFLRSRPSPRASSPRAQSPETSRRRSAIRVLDLMVMLSAAQIVPLEMKSTVLTTCAFLTAKSFIQSAPVPKLVWKILTLAEFALKLMILRALVDASPDSTAISSVLAVGWAVWVVSNPVPTPCEAAQHNLPSGNIADVVFLGHPAQLSDAWALWLLPYSLNERWVAPLWTWPLWPLHYLVGWYVCNFRRKLFGDGASFFCCDDVSHGHTRMQNWVAAHFGRHFVTHPREVRDNIEATARHAERIGVKVLCLGALNKAESINGGGLAVVKALGPKRRLSVIHGNHLTAAAVVETIHQCFGNRKAKLFLTGASSKVGWAVAQALRDRHGYEILCHSTDPGRRRFFEENGFASASTLAEGSAFSTHWIVGKYDTCVARLIPQNATAVVFAVPHPLESRSDVRVIEAGTLHMDLTRLDRPRVFTNKLKEHEIFACHAASLVAAHRLEQGAKRIDEVGPVDPNEMDSWLVDAKKLGFSVPRYEPVKEAVAEILSEGRPPVVIVGAGPSGLAVAAYLGQKQIPHLVLESEEDPNVFGSWGQHFTGLEITTQKKWCSLPGLPMSDADFANETVTGEEYQRYLLQYVYRYAISIRRGVRVDSIEKGSEQTPYIVKCRANGKESNQHDEIAAWSVVVATGKHRVPQKNTSDDLAGKLDSCGIPYVHSTEMTDDATWKKCIEAAQSGKLCIVGFGNSAADLATMILQQCEGDDSGKPTIHIAARTIPPVFPRRAKFLRVDTLGYLMRSLPGPVQEVFVRLLWSGIPDSRVCDAAFPSHLKRWGNVRGRVPVIDKFGTLAAGFGSGALVGHGSVQHVTKEGEVTFGDQPSSGAASNTRSGTKIDMVILATGYREESVIGREDRLNGLYKCGFGRSDRFLPLRSIGEDAKNIADDIARSYK
ncbi:hypothetical protein ACHAXT_004874 [Thalassiosira profunda]